MINPWVNSYAGVMSRLDFEAKGIEDVQHKTFKYAVDEKLQVWVRFSICLDRYVVDKVRRAPKNKE